MSELIDVREQPTTPHDAVLEGVATKYPHIEGLRSPELGSAMGTLVDEFGIEESFFEGSNGDAHTLLLASVASNLTAFENAGKTPLANHTDYEFIADAVTMIAADHTRDFQELTTDFREAIDGPISEERVEEILKTYKSEELTQALNEKIKSGGLFDGIKAKLGVTPENEDDFELVVLSIASSDSGPYGFSPNSEQPSQEMWNTDKSKALKMARENQDDSDAATDWSKGLVERRKKYLSDIGQDYVGPAFVTKPNGKTYMCITADIAERIAYSDDTGNRQYNFSEDDFSRDVAMIEHEYVHTQGGLHLENLIGISIEERRAELFSGDKQGYLDMKVFFQDIALITGYDLIDSLKARPKGGKPAEIFADIAEHIGLDRLIEVVTAQPDTYVQAYGSRISKSLASYTGGYDGVISGILDDTTKAGGFPDAQVRIHERAGALKERFTDDPDMLDTVLKHRARSSTKVTKLLEDATR